MITVATWYWGDRFAPEYVTKLRSMLERNLRTEHELVCVTDRRDLDVYRVDPPDEFRDAPNCIRRMKMYDPAWTRRQLGDTVLMLDLDVVITGDITEMVVKPLEYGADLALWKVGYPSHNRVYAGGVVLMRPDDALGGMWDAFIADPLAFGTRALEHTYGREPGRGWGAISDQAMLNYWVHEHPPALEKMWTWTSAIRPYNAGMESLPAGTKMVTIGHENLDAFQRHDWAREHWR